MDQYLEIYNLQKAFPTPKGPAVIVDEFNLKLHEGEFVALIGHSGCGKSTVLSIVAGLSDATQGSVMLAGKELDGAGPDRGVVFQSPCLLPWMTAFENVLLGVEQAMPHAKRSKHRETAEHYLELVGLGDAMKRKPAELSQGMQQRVGIARAFALSPKMLLLDEPFGMLDSLTRLDLQQVLLDLLKVDRKTALMVTHDVDEALFLADRVVMMTCGPRAKVGDILHVPFEKPRDREAVLAHPDYYKHRAHLVGFLEDQDHQRNVRNGESQGKFTANESNKTAAVVNEVAAA